MTGYLVQFNFKFSDDFEGEKIAEPVVDRSDFQRRLLTREKQIVFSHRSGVKLRILVAVLIKHAGPWRGQKVLKLIGADGRCQGGNRLKAIVRFLRLDHWRFQIAPVS